MCTKAKILCMNCSWTRSNVTPHPPPSPISQTQTTPTWRLHGSSKMADRLLTGDMSFKCTFQQIGIYLCYYPLVYSSCRLTPLPQTLLVRLLKLYSLSATSPTLSQRLSFASRQIFFLLTLPANIGNVI